MTRVLLSLPLSLLLVSCLSTSSPKSATGADALSWQKDSFDETWSILDDPDLPQWILTPPINRDFIYGVGSGETQEQAKRRALINSARQFGGKVESVLVNVETEDGGESYSRIIDQVQDQVIYGAKFAESYRDWEEREWVLVRAPVDCLLDGTEWIMINHSLVTESANAAAFDENLRKKVESDMGKLEIRVNNMSGVYFQSSPSEPEDFVLVEPGSFTMGQTEDEDLLEKEDLHLVELSRPFYMARYEVTQGLWEEITGISLEQQSAISDYPGVYGRGENYPMYHVNWEDAVTFCNELSLRRGFTPAYSKSSGQIICDFTANGYRLPTEAEWEYASRGGHLAEGYRIYSGYDDPFDSGWFWLNSGDKTLEELYPGYFDIYASEENNSRSRPVGLKAPNLLGIYDMSGNIAEWCWDKMDESYYENSPDRDPTGPESGSERVHRGGNWAFTYRICRSAQRNSAPPEQRDEQTGFRLVRTKTD